MSPGPPIFIRRDGPAAKEVDSRSYHWLRFFSQPSSPRLGFVFSSNPKSITLASLRNSAVQPNPFRKKRLLFAFWGETWGKTWDQHVSHTHAATPLASFFHSVVRSSPWLRCVISPIQPNWFRKKRLFFAFTRPTAPHPPIPSAHDPCLPKSTLAADSHPHNPGPTPA